MKAGKSQIETKLRVNEKVKVVPIKKAHKPGSSRYLYSSFGRINSDGWILGTIETLNHGLNPYWELPPRAKRLIKGFLNKEELELVEKNIPIDMKVTADEKIQIFLSKLNEEPVPFKTASKRKKVSK
jgi:hypothetical protein